MSFRGNAVFCCGVRGFRLMSPTQNGAGKKSVRVAGLSPTDAETMDQRNAARPRDLAEAGTGLLAPIGTSDRNR